MEKKTERYSKIEIARHPANERCSFPTFDETQLHIRSNDTRIRTHDPEPEMKPTVCESKPPIEQSRKLKKNLGPVSRLLRRRHQATCFATKSCDNIYSENRTSNSLDWRRGRIDNDQGLQSRRNGSLDWRVGSSVSSASNRLHWRDTARSEEQLSRGTHLSADHPQTPSRKSKLVSLLRRLSPRLPRPGSKGSLQSSPTICPWVQVEYSTESIDDSKREESQESDVSFQQELQLNELRKRMAGVVPATRTIVQTASINKNEVSPHPKIEMQSDKTGYTSYICRAVHEAYGDDERRRASGQPRGGGEVAGLEDVGDSCAATVTSSVPGVGGVRGTRRARPLSLAVQPLNYHRLDPDARSATDAIAARHRPNMTSQESIGSCSLDVDRSASDRSENTVDSVSEKTLHSLNLSCNGEQATPRENPQNGSSETLQKSHLTPDNNLKISNGHHTSPEPEQLTAKKPSYLGLACSVSGYSGLTRYDSKLREGFRSRDSSPGTRLIARDTSPAGFRSNESLCVPGHHYTPKSQSISPLAMERQNGFTNGLKEECKIETYMESRSSISICQGYSEVDKGVPLHSTFPDISPIRSNAYAKRSAGIVQVMSCSQQNKSFPSDFSVSSPKATPPNFANTSFSDTSILNGSAVDVEHQEKSFIQQRVERLYGPGALAQGFFFKRNTSKLSTSDSSFNKSSNNNDILVDNANTEESLKNLPVLRHLRPEFRAQLPVVSPRKPTDGTEQVIKPLQSPRKAEQIPKTSAAPNLVTSIENGAPMTSIPDQQPAAPKVVLPVIEPSASATNVSKLAQEAEKAVEAKDGHYFLKLLKQETERLLSLAASVEAELNNGDPVALPEEAAGKLRSAAGKARLLASQKMQQFEGLCQKNINQVPGEEFPTTDEDLAGFWDMVMLQVIQVNDLFDQIEKLRNSQWQETVPDKKPPTSAAHNGSTSKRRIAVIHKAKPTVSSEANKKAREAREQARRQMLEERRRAMRSNAQNADASVKIFAPES